MVEAELHDGTILEFPDGTAPDVVQRTVKKHLGIADQPSLMARAGSALSNFSAPAVPADASEQTRITGLMDAERAKVTDRMQPRLNMPGSVMDRVPVAALPVSSAPESQASPVAPMNAPTYRALESANVSSEQAAAAPGVFGTALRQIEADRPAKVARIASGKNLVAPTADEMMTRPAAEPSASDPDAGLSDFGKAVKFGFEAAGDSANPIVRGIGQGVAGMGQASAGLGEIFADITGNQDLAESAKAMRQRFKGFEHDAAGQGEARQMADVTQAKNSGARWLEQGVQNASNSITRQIPGLLTGRSGAVLTQMFFDSLGNEYGEAKARGKSADEALARASVFATFEVLGEKLGLDYMMPRLRQMSKGVATEQLPQFFAGVLRRELPGELFTHAGQSATEASAIGLRPGMTLEQYLSEIPAVVRDTLIQTGMMTGAGSAMNAGIGRIQANSQDLTAGVRFDPGQIDAAARQALDPANAQMRIAVNPPRAPRAELETILNDDRPVEEILAEQAQQADLQKQEESDLAYLRRAAEAEAAKAADFARAKQQQADLTVDQANALTRAQGFDDPAPTAMQLAMQRAAERRNAVAGDGTRAAPVKAETAEHVAIAEQQVDTQPTEKQKDANNYKHGHLQLQGLDIAIENPAGSVRSGVSKSGKPWANVINHTYGYIKGATAADGDKLDAFIGPNPQSQAVYVIDQIDPDTGRYDEGKVMLGFNSADEAQAAYLSNYDAGWRGLGAITPMHVDAFKAWIAKGDTHKPLAYKRTEPAAQPAQTPVPPAQPEPVAAAAPEVAAQPAPALSVGRLDETAVVAAPTKKQLEMKARAEARKAASASAQDQGADRGAVDVAAEIARHIGGTDPREQAAKIKGLLHTNAAGLREVERSLKTAPEDRIIPLQTQAVQHEQNIAKLSQWLAHVEPNPEASRPNPVVESQAPAPSEPGDGGVAPTQDKAAPAPEERAYPKGQAQLLAKRMTHQGLPSEAYPHPTQAGMWAIRVPVEQAAAPAAEAEKIPTSSPKAESDAPARVAEAPQPKPAIPAAEPTAPEPKTIAEASLGDLLRAAADKADGKVAAPQGKGNAASLPSEAAKEREGAGQIADFGDRIEGARKDYAAKLKDAEAADIASVPLSQSWPEPDYQKMLDDGADSWAVAFMRAARDEVPTKPQSPWKLSRWVKQVAQLRDFAMRVVDGSMGADRVKDAMGTDSGMKEILDRIALYIEVGHAKSLKGIRVSAGDYGVYDGIEYSPPKRIWSVEQKAAKTAFSHWPKMIATGDTREEAISNFKAKWLETTSDQDIKKAIDFSIYSRRGELGFFIGKKIGKDVVPFKEGFKTAKEARDWKDANQSELVKMLERFKDIPSERRESNSPRVGIDHRNGADVTPQQFAETFGFRGGQFGASMPQAERQSNLNETYDALMDMAGILGIPPKALSLNGELGLAFGARGKGGKGAFAAHYEPDTTGAVTADRVVINLTRARGAGSLAHEWFHAVDNYFARKGGRAGAYQTEAQRGEGVRPEMLDAFKRVMQAINSTSLKMRGRKLDQTRSKAYWSTGLEMAARSFESYIVAKLQDQGASNDYLANIVSEDYWNAAAALGIEKEGTYPYPTADEAPAIRAAFDHFFQTVETKETDKGVALESRAYHGSPYRFSKFTLDHIGMGEGAQAYGWGLYFAGQKDIAEHYRNTLSRGFSLERDGKKFDPAWGPTSDANEMALSMAAGRLKDALRYDRNATAKTIADAAMNAADSAERDARKYNEPSASKREAMISDQLRTLANEALDGKLKAVRGQLYEVEIPEDGEYLLWDKPLSEQPEKVREAIYNSNIAAIGKDALGWRGAPEGMHEKAMARMGGEQFYRDLAQSEGSDEAASKYLNSLGIAGIKYLDGASRNRPLREIKREFLAELPEDADFADVEELLGTGTFSPANEAVIKALQADNWLGFDYPAQALSAALGDRLAGFDASKALKDAVEAAQDGSTYNYVIFDENAVEVLRTHYESRAAAAITNETPATIRAGLSRSLGKATVDRLEQSGLLRILDTADSLPDGLTISSTGTALYDGKIAYLIADRMKPENAIREALHEIGEHHGLEGMLGEKGYKALGNRVRFMEKAGNARVKEAFAFVRSAYPELREDSPVFVKEVLANIGQDADVRAKPWWKEMIAAVRRFLVKIGYGGMIRTSDIEDMVLHSLKTAAREDQFAGAGNMIEAMASKVGADGTAFKAVDTESAEGGATNPSILESRQAALPNTGTTPPAPPTRQTPIALQGGAPGNRASWNGYEPSKLDDVIRTLQDKQIDSKRTVQAIRDAGRQVADKWDVYLQETLFHGRAAKRTLEFVETELNPLAKDLAMRGLSMAQLEEFLHARHAEEANALIADRNPAMPDGGSGMTNQQAQDYFAQLDPAVRSRLEAVARRVDAIIARTRQLYVSYGLESQETVDGWADTFQHYVPLMREDKDGGMGIGQGFSIKGKETKSRTGSTRTVVDILANIAMQRERAIVRGEKNRVATALMGLAKLNPNPDFWTFDKVPHEQVFNPKTGLVEDRPDPMFKTRDNVVVAKIADGKGGVQERAVVFAEDNEQAMHMARALKNLDAAQLEGLIGATAKLTRYFASVNTQYNPIFGVTNLVRDVQDAMLNLTSTPIAGHKADVLKHTLGALRGIYIDTRQMRKGQPATSAYAQLWEEFQHEGGQTGYRDMFRTSADRAHAIEKMIDPHGWTDSPLGKVFTAGGLLKVPLTKAQDIAGPLFDWLSDYNEAMENAVRLAAYKVGKEQGMSNQQAAAMAKGLTVNFNKRGSVGLQVGALYAFFNASMQGTGRIAETLFTIQGNDAKTIRLSGVGKKIVAGGILLGSMQALMLAAMGFGDDEPPEFVRERNTIIPIGDKKYITIPMPLGFAILPNIGRVSTEFVLGGFKSPAKHVARLMGIMADAFNPVGGNGTILQILSPTALDPVVALAENKDWTKKPIAKVSYDKTTPGHKLWKDTASTPGKWIAEAINTMSGGTKYVAGAVSPTPDQIDYLFGQVTGGVGREAVKLEQSIVAAATGEDLPPHKIPLVGRFYGDAAAQSSQATTFYNNVNRINEYEAQIKGLRKDGKASEVGAFVAENPEARLVLRANHAERAVQKLRKEKHDLIEKDAPRGRVKIIENRIKAEMERFNRAVEASKQRQKEAA